MDAGRIRYLEMGPWAQQQSTWQSPAWERSSQGQEPSSVRSASLLVAHGRPPNNSNARTPSSAHVMGPLLFFGKQALTMEMISGLGGLSTALLGMHTQKGFLLLRMLFEGSGSWGGITPQETQWALVGEAKSITGPIRKNSSHRDPTIPESNLVNSH